MDSFKPMQLLSVDNITLHTRKYKLWMNGVCISEGVAPLTFSVKKVQAEGTGIYQCSLHCEELNKLIDTDFDFDALLSLHDRLLLCLSPKESNVQDVTFGILKIVLGETRDSLFVSETRPVCMSFFFENGNIVKASIKILSPERLIEVW